MYLYMCIVQLVSMNWKLGVAMSSSSCRSLSTPYISLQLRMSESAGTTQLHSIEMTVPEFQVISNRCPYPTQVLYGT